MGAVPACEAVQYYMLLLVATLAKFPHLHVTSEILYLDSTIDVRGTLYLR